MPRKSETEAGASRPEPMTPSETRCYRLRTSYRNIGLANIAFFIPMAIFSISCLWLQPAGDRGTFFFTTTVFLLFASLGLYLLTAQRTYRLIIAGSSITEIGVFSERHADLRSVDELRWRRFPRGGSVCIAGSSEVLKIDLDNFTQEERRQLIDYFRASVAESRQVGWQRFEEQFAETPARRKRSAHAELILTIVFAAHAIGFAVAWAIGGGIQNFVFSVINVVVAGYLVRSRRRRAATEAELSEPIGKSSSRG